MKKKNKMTAYLVDPWEGDLLGWVPIAVEVTGQALRIDHQIEDLVGHGRREDPLDHLEGHTFVLGEEVL